jgi:UDP-N-acetylglucosamine 2-epimerase (non-hydrolysing)
MTTPRPGRKVLCVFGTRPEVIKMAPVVRALAASAHPFDVRLCATAQHRDLLDPLLTLFGLTPNHDLDLMRPGQTLHELTGLLFQRLGHVMSVERPDWVLVQGDTTTAMVGALCGFYAGARVGHVEAGLRTGSLAEPFPEEMNRSVIGRVASLHFAPTERARANLLAEGVDPGSILVTGNTAIDALQWALSQPLPTSLPVSLADGQRLIFVTLHRRESFGAPLAGMCEALRDVALAHGPGVRFVCPVHPNPHVGPVMRELLGDLPNVQLTAPLDYLTTVHLLARCYMVVTDSGGIQEEAPGLGKPVLVLRNTTERPEGVEAGVALLVGTDRERIVGALTSLLDDDEAYWRMATAVSPYGDGQAAGRIVAALAAGS